MTEAEYEKRYHQAPCGLVSFTPEGVILDVNDTFLAWTGHSETDVVGARFASLLDPGSRLFYETRHAQVLLLQGAVREVALTMVRADGSLLPVLVNSVMVDDGGSTVVRAAVFDATERVQYERDLLHARKTAEYSEARVRILQDISIAFDVSASDQDVAESIAAVCAEAFATTEIAVLLIDSFGSLELVAGRNPLAETVPPIAALRNSPVVVAVHAEEVESEYPVLAAGLRLARLESLSITPLMSDKERLGVLVCFYARRREFDDEYYDLQRALGRQASQTLVRVRLQRQLRYLALHDQLTGVANRQLLQEHLDVALDAAAQRGEPLAVVFLDVDEFKSVNDRWGHAVGDAVLKELAARLRRGVRANDVVGRIGGDEFVAICEGADLQAASSIAERVLRIAREPIDVDGLTLTVSVSAGVATYRPDREPRPAGEAILVRADGAMYRSKDTGRNRVTVEDEAIAGAV